MPFSSKIFKVPAIIFCHPDVEMRAISIRRAMHHKPHEDAWIGSLFQNNYPRPKTPTRNLLQLVEILQDE